jgi:hypothetical protein
MLHTSLTRLTSNQLVVEAAAFARMAARANTLEARQALERLAERYRELAARRAALACLGDEDPARPMLAHKIERLIQSIGEGQSSVTRR